MHLSFHMCIHFSQDYYVFPVSCLRIRTLACVAYCTPGQNVSLSLSFSCFFLAVGKCNVGVLLDGGIKKHLGMVQRWIYNMVLMFQRGSQISFGSYGAKVALVCLLP